MHCNSCGNNNPENSATCIFCGAPLNQPQNYNQDQSTAYNNQGYNSYPCTDQQAYPPQPPYPPAHNAAPYNASAEPEKSKSFPGKSVGIAAFILGVCSLALYCIPVLGLALAVVGLIMSIVSMSKSRKAGRKNGFAIAGLVCACVGLVVGIIYDIAFFAALAEGISSAEWSYYW